MRCALPRGPAGRWWLVADQSQVSPSEYSADHQPFEVPLKRSAYGLVEIIEVKDQPPLRRGVEAKVRQVAVAAELHLQATA